VESGGSSQGRQSYAGRGPKDYKRSDERIQEEVSDRLTDDHSVDASEISVQVKNGEVTLSGTVSSRDQKRRVEDLAESISGVSEVNNMLKVKTQANGSGSQFGSSASAGHSLPSSATGSSASGKARSNNQSE
jgi:hypothetical protein